MKHYRTCPNPTCPSKKDKSGDYSLVGFKTDSVKDPYFCPRCKETLPEYIFPEAAVTNNPTPVIPTPTLVSTLAPATPVTPAPAKPTLTEPAYLPEPKDHEYYSERGRKKKNTAVVKILGVILLAIIILIVILFWQKGCQKNTNNLTPTPTPSITTAAEVNTIKVDGETVETFISTVVTTDGKYTLHDPDQKEVVVDLSKAIGFVPDKDLLISNLKTETLGQDPASITQNWDTYLNSSNKPYAGFTDGTNDYNQYYNHQSGPQVPAYSWMIHTGLYVEMPGIGRVEGGPGRAVLILILNRTDRVYRFPTNSVTVIAGFEGWGRIWNGDEKPVIETEKRITNHFLTRLGLGVPEKGFIGQTDQGAENATTVTVITVERLQWGNNPDGTPRYQFQLLRAETVPTIKK